MKDNLKEWAITIGYGLIIGIIAALIIVYLMNRF